MFQIIAINFLFGIYISLRIYRAFFTRIKFYVAVPVIFVFAQLFFISKFVSMTFGVIIPEWLMNISYVFLGISVYLFLFFLLFDVLWISGLRKTSFFKNKFLFGLIVLSFTAVTFAYGYYHQLDTIVKHYDIELSKPLKEPLKAAVISDIHIGSGMTVERINKYVEEINGNNPDIIFIVGDIIDSDLRSFTEEYRQEFRKLDAPLGVYAVLGNHEYYSGPIDEVEAALEDAGMNVLKDESIFFEDKGFYLLGRDSIRRYVTVTTARKPFEDLIAPLDRSKPLIVLDHVPKSIEDGKAGGTDLQFSGHTHGGQFFPITAIVKLMYPESGGHLKDGDFNLIVTTGLGLWGPPMRIGSDSEILIVNIK